MVMAVESPEAQGPRYVPLADEARRLGVSDMFLRRAARQGRIQLFRAGKKLLLLHGAADTLVCVVPPVDGGE